jgi:hypothetical protein
MTISSVDLVSAIAMARANSVNTLDKSEHAVGLSSLAASGAASVVDKYAVFIAVAENMTHMAAGAMARSNRAHIDASLEHSITTAMTARTNAETALIVCTKADSDASAMVLISQKAATAALSMAVTAAEDATAASEVDQEAAAKVADDANTVSMMATEILRLAKAAAKTANQALLYAQEQIPAHCESVGTKETMVDLQSAGTFAILCQAALTTVGPSFIGGDIGVSPIAATAMTGFDFTPDVTSTFSTSSQVNGKAFGASYASPTPAMLTTAVADMRLAYTDAASRLATHTHTQGILGGSSLGGFDLPLSPGVHRFTTSIVIKQDIYLKGTGLGTCEGATDVFVIQTTGNLTQLTGTRVFLMNGALAQNIFWQIPGYVTVQAQAHLVGVVLSATYVTFVTGSSLSGRIFAQTACTLGQTAVTPPGGALAAANMAASMAAELAETAAVATDVANQAMEAVVAATKAADSAAIASVVAASALRAATTEWQNHTILLEQLENTEALFSSTTSDLETITAALACAEAATIEVQASLLEATIKLDRQAILLKEFAETKGAALARAQAPHPVTADESLTKLLNELAESTTPSTRDPIPYLCISYIVLSSLTVLLSGSISLLHVISGIYMQRRRV